MELSRDERGQSVWLGFLFLVLFLVLALTVYQASVVPTQTARVEAQHAEAVAESMHQLYGVVGLLGKTGGTQTVAVDLGPSYPTRLAASNPAPPAGSLATTYRGNVTVSVDGSPVNLSRICGYGSGARVPTRSLRYAVDYNRYSPGPQFVVGQSVFYRQVNGTHIVAGGQSLVQNDTIRLSPLATSYSEGGTGTAQVRLVAGPTGRTGLNASSGKVRVEFPSGLPAAKWQDVLDTQPAVTAVEQVSSRRVAVVLEAGPTYSLTCYAVGVGHAPPSGTRPLTGEPVESPAGDHAPAPSIDNATATMVTKGSHNESHVTVNWSVSDPDADLKSVTVRVVDLNNTNVQSRTFDVEGVDGSGEFTFIFGRGGQAEGTHYDVVVLATDRAGNEAKTNETVTTG